MKTGVTLCFGSIRLNMGAFFSMSGMIINLCESAALRGHKRENTSHRTHVTRGKTESADEGAPYPAAAHKDVLQVGSPPILLKRMCQQASVSFS